MMDKAGVHSTKNYYIMVIEVGGYQNLTFREKEYQKHIKKVRNELLGEGDAETFHNYLVLQTRNG